MGIQAYEGTIRFRIGWTGAPHARYAVAERRGNRWAVDFFAVDYDWDAAARLVEERGRPDWSASQNWFVAD